MKVSGQGTSKYQNSIALMKWNQRSWSSCPQSCFHIVQGGQN